MKGKTEWTKFPDPSKHRMGYRALPPTAMHRSSRYKASLQVQAGSPHLPIPREAAVLAGVNWINKKWELHHNYSQL